jgi:sulfur-oxidizing protein SoxY
MAMIPIFTRREALALGAGAMTATVLGAAPALAKNDADEAIKAFTGGKTPVQGKVKPDLPEIAENGNTVPMTVSVDSPMTEAAYVKAIHVVTDNNPQPEVASFYLSPANGKAEVQTRIRLATTMHVIAYTELSDGTVWSDQAEAKVTIGGCGG